MCRGRLAVWRQCEVTEPEVEILFGNTSYPRFDFGVRLSWRMVSSDAAKQAIMSCGFLKMTTVSHGLFQKSEHIVGATPLMEPPAYLFHDTLMAPKRSRPR